MRDPNTQLPKKIDGQPAPKTGGSQAPAAQQQPLPLELIDCLTPDGAPDIKALEAKGLLPKYLRVWNNPATLKLLKTVSQLIKADGIDLKDKAAVKAWAGENPEKLDPAAARQAAGKQETFTKSGPSAGRNDPCPCGSGKKFKKCCAAK